MNIEAASENLGYDYTVSGHNRLYLIELKQGIKATRDLRATMLSMAMALREQPDCPLFLLVLLHPEMARGTIADEWTEFYHTIDPALRPQLELLVQDENGLERIAPYANEYILRGTQEIRRGADYEIPRLPMEEIKEIIRLENQPKRGKLPQPDFFHVLSSLLIKNLFNNNNFLKTKELQELAGCSYPSVQRVLKKLEPWIERDSSRSLHLKSFPNDIWWKLLSNATAARHTVHYQDISGQPRSIEFLIKRIRKLGMIDIAVGGVTAALHHYPKLDIVGSPRLDLIVHAPPTRANRLSNQLSAKELASKIDPGLEETSDPTKPVRLAIHYLRRRENGFIQSPTHDYSIADEVECLYDLHDARLTPQAEQFLNHLKHHR